MKEVQETTSPDGVLGVSPILFKFPQDWGIQGVDHERLILRKGLYVFNQVQEMKIYPLTSIMQ